MFRIGQDNILSYNFNIGDINSDELVNIFANMKDRKKYYRLKNGNILNLEDESLKEIPDDIDYEKISNLASEARQKLEKIRPKTIAQASRISGVNPVDISVLTIYLKKEYGKNENR